jgi:hypothetical protein
VGSPGSVGRRDLGEVGVDRVLAPPVRGRVDGLVAPDPGSAASTLEVRVLDPVGEALEVRVEDLVVPDLVAVAFVAPEAALEVAGLAAGDPPERSTACSRARTRCWRRATSSLVAMPSTPS